jgi:hypothetical protein
MAVEQLGSTRRFIAVALAAEAVYQITSANMSSPQTAELNAAARAPTIGKWVTLNNIEALGWIALFCVLDGSLWPAFGGGLAAGGMWLKYRYAIRSGLQSGAPPTENYQS